jgi:CYTH domain-containing protein
MGIEIEKKFLVKEMPKDLGNCPFHLIEQGYLNVHPAIRVRKEDDSYYMTYKGTDESYEGIGKVEYNMPLNQESYEHMIEKADGNVITKKRYLVPLNDDAFSSEYLEAHHELKDRISEGRMKIELDGFEGVFEGRILAEVEFPDEEAAANYKPAAWFSEDVTGDLKYSNSTMSREKF